MNVTITSTISSYSNLHVLKVLHFLNISMCDFGCWACGRHIIRLLCILEYIGDQNDGRLADTSKDHVGNMLNVMSRCGRGRFFIIPISDRKLSVFVSKIGHMIPDRIWKMGCTKNVYINQSNIVSCVDRYKNIRLHSFLASSVDSL